MITLYNWLLKEMGYHVCEEFTQWETKESYIERLPTHNEQWNMIIGGHVVLKVSEKKRYQERQCTICGKIEQRKLKYQ